jgi:hypothetical protein
LLAPASLVVVPADTMPNGSRGGCVTRTLYTRPQQPAEFVEHWTSTRTAPQSTPDTPTAGVGGPARSAAAPRPPRVYDIAVAPTRPTPTPRFEPKHKAGSASGDTMRFLTNLWHQSSHNGREKADPLSKDPPKIRARSGWHSHCSQSSWARASATGPGRDRISNGSLAIQKIAQAIDIKS